MDLSTIYALISVTIVSLLSFAGLLTLSMSEKRLRRSIFLFVALAAGAMIGDAFLHLLPEAVEKSGNFTQTSLLVISGILLFFTVEKLLKWHHGHDEVVSTSHLKECAGPDCEKLHHQKKDIMPIGHMILFSDGIHNFLDGVLIALSYLVDTSVGLATTIAIVLHELPHEAGDFGVLLHAGYSKRKALFYNFISALTAVLGTVLVILVGDSAELLLEWVLPVSAGTFIYIASSDLVPELHRKTGLWNTITQLVFITIGVALMYGLLFLD